MTTNTSGVRLEALSKRFSTGAIGIEDASIDIASGEFVTFLGPSGSGKTTTLSLIAGFAKPTSGRVEIGGRDVTDLPASRRNLGVVFQNYALFPHMSVRDNVAFGLHGRGLSKSEASERIDEALRLVHLTGYDDRAPKQLSGGQQQRVALARALVYRPPVLLMDEPLSALDKALRDQMQVEIGRIHREIGTTFLFVTHDQGEAMGLSDRIVLFNNGRIEQVGSPSDLYERPRTLFAARFLGESNVFTGHSRGGEMAYDGRSLSVLHSEASGDVALIIRPEHMVVVTDHHRPSEFNTLPAVVTDVSYNGSFRRILIQFPDGTSGRLHEPVGEPTLSVGGSVMVGWHPANGVVVPLDKAAP
ncbi:ABC transporter ATP-binding protein [Streptomyces sp. NPDC001520]|uniref:ABC transporter ATP-binding protein n=1 Tax=Streptomyces sp. NPDC001520 TaxID=3364581 RepID=UPI0036AA262E